MYERKRQRLFWCFTHAQRKAFLPPPPPTHRKTDRDPSCFKSPWSSRGSLVSVFHPCIQIDRQPDGQTDIRTDRQTKRYGEYWSGMAGGRDGVFSSGLEGGVDLLTDGRACLSVCVLAGCCNVMLRVFRKVCIQARRKLAGWSSVKEGPEGREQKDLRK
mmetsp:Transcript_50235/g.98921  ORF Transcript_50235/g.98921 Transcript_50235/m.98921 type:complete len:159 (+) Transcript_50235:1477-1953(+)